MGATPAAPVSGQAVSFTATVSAGTGPPPTGSVDFIDTTTGTDLGSVNLVNGTASLPTISTLAIGSHQITATYSSSDVTRFQNSSTAQPLAVTIIAAKTTTTLDPDSPNPSVYGQPLVFQVSAAAPGIGVPTGVVAFTTSTGTSLGSADLVNGVATMPVTALAAGSYKITASYQGDGNFASSSTAQPIEQVVKAASTSTSLSASATREVTGNAITFTAVVMVMSPSKAMPAGTVQFMDNGTALGTPQPIDQTGTATFTTGALAVGTHTITAVYTDMFGNFSTSTGTVGNLQIISPIATSVTFATTSPVKFGFSTTLTATLAYQPLITTAPVGAIDFFDTTTNTNLGSAVPVNGVATLNYTVALEPGPHAIVAMFAGDSRYLPSGSAATTNLNVLSLTEVTWTQDISTNPSEVSLREAITYADSNPGQTITFLPSLAGQTITLTNGPLPDLTQNVVIDGLGASLLTFNEGGTGSGFYVDAGVTAAISGLTITGGNTLQGGGIYNAGKLTVIDCAITSNMANWGAGIANLGTLDVEHSTFSGNTAFGYNGADGQFAGGGGGGGAALGGGLFNSGTATLVDSTMFRQHRATRGNGGNSAYPYGEFNGGGGPGGTAGSGATAVAGAAGSFGGGGAGGAASSSTGAPGGAGGFGAGGGGGGGRTSGNSGGSGGAGGYDGGAPAETPSSPVAAVAAAAPGSAPACSTTAARSRSPPAPSLTTRRWRAPRGTMARPPEKARPAVSSLWAGPYGSTAPSSPATARRPSIPMSRARSRALGTTSSATPLAAAGLCRPTS